MCCLRGLPQTKPEHILRVNLPLQLAQLVQSSPKALIYLVSRRSKASIASLHRLLGGLDLISETVDPSESVIHSHGLVVAGVDEELDVWCTQTERGGLLGLYGAAVVQEAGYSVGCLGVGQGSLEDVDDLRRHSRDGHAAGGCVSGRGDVLGCQTLESVEGGFFYVSITG